MLSCEKNDCKVEYYYELYVVTMCDKITMIQKQEYSIDKNIMLTIWKNWKIKHCNQLSLLIRTLIVSQVFSGTQIN